jgi:dipeptidyl aminopeptidase/acylaminoacyl peptidase
MGSVAWRNYEAALLDFAPWDGSPALAHPELSGVPELRTVEFKSAAGLNVAAWYVPSRNHAAVVLAHGTNADRSSMLPEIRILATAGYGVLAFDWPGNGASEGSNRWGDEEQQALSAAVAFLAAQPDVERARIGGLGFSKGGYLMTLFAAGDPSLRAVVIEAVSLDFERYLRRLHDHWGFVSEWPAYFAVRHAAGVLVQPTPGAVISRIAPRPILFISGTLDEAVPSAMVTDLYAAAAEPKSLWVVPGAQHGHYADVAPIEYRERLLAFFDSALLGTLPATQTATAAP